MASEVTILPPEQIGDEPKRGAGGFREGAGRKPGVMNGFTRTVRDGLQGALSNMGGAEHYFTYLAAVRPDLFVQLLGRAMPIKIAGDEQPLVISQISRRIMPK